MKKQIWLLILVFIFGCSDDEPLEITIPTLTSVFEYNNIEDDPISDGTRQTNPTTGLDYTGWGVYEDIIFPGTTIEWSVDHATQPALEGQSLECAITGGDRYNNAFFTNTIALKWEGEDWLYKDANYLEYELDFYIDGVTDCNNPNNSTLEGIEFTWQHILIPISYGFGVQWSKGGEWRYWNDEFDPQAGKAVGWESFSPQINTCLAANTWHHIKLIGEQLNEGSHYISMEINGQVFDISNISLDRAEVQSGWVENFLQVGMQINGNQALDVTHGHGVDPVKVYLDNVTFRGYRKE